MAPMGNKDQQEIKPIINFGMCPFYHMNVEPLNHLFQLLSGDPYKNCTFSLVVR